MKKKMAIRRQESVPKSFFGVSGRRSTAKVTAIWAPFLKATLVPMKLLQTRRYRDNSSLQLRAVKNTRKMIWAVIRIIIAMSVKNKAKRKTVSM